MAIISCLFMLRASDLGFAYVSTSVDEVLGLEDQYIYQLKLTDLLEDNEQGDVVEVLRDAVRQNKAASLLYLRLLDARPREFVVCQMAISVAGNVIVGSLCQVPLATIGTTLRDRSAEEVIVITDFIDYPGTVGYPAVNWTGTHFPRTVLLLDRYSNDLTITHCTNNAILNNETCVQRPFYRYVAARDEASVRSFLSSMRQSTIGGDSMTNVGFVYHTFMLCVAGRDPRASPRSAQDLSNGANEIRASALGLATSDGIILVLKCEP